MKTIGICIDNHKQDKFEEALHAADYSFMTSKLSDQVKIIKVMVTPEDFEKATQEIAKICKTLQINFNRSN